MSNYEALDDRYIDYYIIKDGYWFYIPSRLVCGSLESSHQISKQVEVFEEISNKPECVVKEEDRCISSILN